MRRDMSKVVTDCYRHRSDEQNPDTLRNRRRRSGSRGFDELPNKERMLPHHQKFIDRREFGDHVTPLYRFLESKVGEHWDRIYSEISEHLNRNSTTHRHIFQHLWDHVAKHVEVREGKLGEISRRGTFYPFRNDHLYIDPVTKILKKFRAPPKPKKKEPDISYARKKGRYFRKAGGVWVELKFLPIPPHVEIEPGVWEGGKANDLIKGTIEENFSNMNWRQPWFYWFNLRNVYCSEILSLTPGQMQYLGLKNN